MFSLLCFLGLSVVSAVQLVNLQEPNPQNTATIYAYALDLSVFTSQINFNCVKTNLYSSVFIRGYNPAGNGAYDTNAAQNVKNAYNAGLGTEVYMTPQPGSSKTAATQMNEMISGLSNNGVSIRSVWIQVTSPINWGCNTVINNINFINGLITTARNKGLSVGIYTSIYDWQQITNNWTGVPSGTMLWYWNVYGPGVNGESPANFNDFRPFGSFNAVTVKQFAQSETVCNTPVNRDLYVAAASSFGKLENDAKLTGPIVGFIGL